MRRIGWMLVAMLLIGCGASEASDDSPDSPITTTASEESLSSSAESSAMTTTTISNNSSVGNGTAAVGDSIATPSASTGSTATNASTNSTAVTITNGSTTPSVPAPTTTVVPTTVPPPADPVGLRVEAEYTSGYNRDLFRHWIDADGDGCETRKEVLIAESLEPVQTGSQCAILTGRWYSIYDNTETTDSSRFDIDHVVALKEAWDSGAWNWTADQRKEFANDLSEPFFLIAVSASSNRSKSDRDPAEWLPTNTAYRCDYVRIWIDVKRAWNLSVDPECRCAQAMVLLTKAANSGPRSSCRK